VLDWQTVRPALVTLFEGLTDGAQVVWARDREPYVDPVGQAIVVLRVSNERDHGVDDRRYNDLNVAAPDPTLEEVIAGHRRVVVEARVESFDADDDRFAYNLSTAMRTRIKFSRNLAALRAIEFALAKVEQTQDIGGVVIDDRELSVAITEFVFNAAHATADTGEANRLYNIETVNNPVDHDDTELNH